MTRPLRPMIVALHRLGERGQRTVRRLRSDVAAWPLMLVVAIALGGTPVAAQNDTSGEASQLWGNVILGIPLEAKKLYFEFDFEPKVQIDAGNDSRGAWKNLDVTSLVEFYPWSLVDLTGEIVTGYTKQTADENSFELSLRLGTRFHFVNELYARTRPDRHAGRRFGIANLLRLELRNFRYDSDRPTSHELRLRNRLELKLALSSSNLGVDGAWYALGDIEGFLPITDDVAERFASKGRVRLGIGHRKSYTWRFEVLVQRDFARDTLDDPFQNDANVLDIRVKRLF